MLISICLHLIKLMRPFQSSYLFPLHDLHLKYKLFRFNIEYLRYTNQVFPADLHSRSCPPVLWIDSGH